MPITLIGMDNTETALYCMLISLLWGGTNPLIKKSTKGITHIQTHNCVTRFINEIKYLIVNWKYVLFFLINQAGSVLYFVLLQSVDLSLIVPIVNALTFVFSGLVGFLLGEKIPDFRTFTGLVFIIAGITCCVFDKIEGSPLKK